MGGAAALGPPALAVLLAWPLNWARTARGLRARGLAPREAAGQAALLTLAKLPTLQGMLTWHWRRWRGAATPCCASTASRAA